MKNVRLRKTKKQNEIEDSEKKKLKIGEIDFNDKRLSFNFSFLTKTKKYNFESGNCKDDMFILLLNRIQELSESTFNYVMALDRAHGIEGIALDSISSKEKIRSLDIREEFKTSKRYRLSGKKIWIMRLCPNNNPYETRLIGRLIDQTFYLMFLDYKHDLYKKRK